MLSTTFAPSSSFEVWVQDFDESFDAIDRFSLHLSKGLIEFRDKRVFEDGGYKSFEDFCNDRLSRHGGYRRVNQLLGFGQVIEVLKGTELDGVIKRESHARPVLRLVKSPEKLQQAVAIALEENPNPTAEDFKAAADKVDPRPQRTKSEEQLFLTGTKVKVSSQDHVKHGEEGVVTSSLKNRQRIVLFLDGDRLTLRCDELEYIGIERIEDDRDSEKIAQLKEQHRQEIERLEAELLINLKVTAEAEALKSAREQLEASQAIANAKAKEVATLRQEIERLQSLQTLETENNRLKQEIEQLRRDLERRPFQEWDNTFTKDAEKALNVKVIKSIKEVDPDLNLKVLATSTPSNADEVLKLMSLAMGNLAIAIGSAKVLSAAAMLLNCNPTREAITKTLKYGVVPATTKVSDVSDVPTTPLTAQVFSDYESEKQQMIIEAVAGIRQGLIEGLSYLELKAIADEYETIKQDYWVQLTKEERKQIVRLKQEFDEQVADEESTPTNTWDTPQQWQTGARSCKYQKLGSLHLIFNDEQWLAVKDSDTQGIASPQEWMELWVRGEAKEGAIAHVDINKAAWTYHGSIQGVIPQSEQMKILWEEIPDVRLYDGSELRVRED